MKKEHSLLKIQHVLEFGTDRIKPRNESARIVLKLTGRKSFLLDDIAILEILGFEIEWLPRSLIVDDNGNPIL